MYFSQQVLIKSWIFWSFISISFLSAATLDRREIPEGLYHDCRGGALGEVCAGVIKEAWEAGRLKTFDGEHKFYTRSGTCKITYWTETGSTVDIDNIEQIQDAVSQIDKFCQSSDLPMDRLDPKPEIYRGVFVGQVGEKYVTIMLDGNPKR